jgi:hypothetical protein
MVAQKPKTPKTPTAFVSYSWDSDAHRKWVLDFASRLRSEGGIEVILDRWHLPLGGDKTAFMEKAVNKSKFVIIICTPQYAKRADKRKGGVGYEATIVTGALAENITQRKFIPILRDGDWRSSLPTWIKTKIGVDLRNDPYSDEQYQQLLRTLHNESLKPPPVGPKPLFEENSTSELRPQRQDASATTKEVPVRKLIEVRAAEIESGQFVKKTEETKPKKLGITIRFYLEFFNEDFPSLPLPVQNAVGDFLQKLQENPESAELLQNAQRDKSHPDRFAHIVAHQYVMYWQLVRPKPTQIIELSSQKPIRVDVLGLRKLGDRERAERIRADEEG